MSNQSVLECMWEACNRFDSGRIDTVDLEGEIESLCGVLEGMKESAKTALKEFSHGIWWGSELCYEDEKNENGWRELNQAVTKLRDWIATELGNIGVNAPARKPDAGPDSD